MDDPEGQQVYQSLLSFQGERIRILSHERYRVGECVTAACGRRTAKVDSGRIRLDRGRGDVERQTGDRREWGRIRHQIEDGGNGFLVSSVEEAAARIIQLIKDEELRRQIGKRARETVKKRFLLTRLLEQYLDVFNSFETIHPPRDRPDI